MTEDDSSFTFEEKAIVYSCMAGGIGAGMVVV